MPLIRFCFVALMLFMVLPGCSKTDSNRKQTFPLTGEVFVDGQPAENLAVNVFDERGVDDKNPTYSEALTEENGKFSLHTYAAADGVPEGKYVVTFYWGTFDLMSRSYGGADKLNERYKDPEKSQFRVEVLRGKPKDMGRIELTTK